MKFKIVTERARTVVEFDEASAVSLSGRMTEMGYHREHDVLVRGLLLPSFQELAGPMIDGDYYRYEDWTTYDLLSM